MLNMHSTYLSAQYIFVIYCADSDEVKTVMKVCVCVCVCVCVRTRMVAHMI